MNPELVEEILERYGEANNTLSNPSKRDLDKQVIERIEDIFRNPDKAEIKLQELRDDEKELQKEKKKIEETKQIQEAYMKYVQMIAAKKLPVALNYFQAHSLDIIEWYVRWWNTEKLSFDLRTFLLLLQNRTLFRQVPSNWMEHTMI